MGKKQHSDKVKLSDNPEWADVFTDGASEPNNPGHGGWAYVALIKKQEVHRDSGSFKLTTNNRMELMAALKGIRYVVENYGVRFVKLHSDSKYVVNGVGRWVDTWARENYEGRLNADLWRQVFELKKEVDIRTFFVKGHNGDHYNEICDGLAYGAAIEQKNSEDDTRYMIARETMTKEEMINSPKKPSILPLLYKNPMYCTRKKRMDREFNTFLDLPNT
jgi:ribonuclease HI